MQTSRRSGHEQISSKRLRNACHDGDRDACRRSPADAKIECRGNFQVTKYGLISTPYCEEEQIARVARSYGVNVTGAEVRNNALTKVYLCQVYGYDTRLKGSCAGYAPELYGR
ncbi:MAG TPA: hypothetical protein VHK26_02810 [Methyloceanibacter sp.]|jgi:hypothetical protein|nr:hypothetical protein [Methyloceanibacter sp.]